MRSQRLDLSDNERSILITTLRRLVDFDPQAAIASDPGLEGHPRTAGAAEATAYTRYCEHWVRLDRKFTAIVLLVVSAVLLGAADGSPVINHIPPGPEGIQDA